MKKFHYLTLLLATLSIGLLPATTLGQEDQNSLVVHIAQGSRDSFSEKSNDFSVGDYRTPDGSSVREFSWSFGDGTRATGDAVSHAYKNPGTYTVRLLVTTDSGQTAEDTTEIRVFGTVNMLVIDSSFPEEQLRLFQEQAARQQVLLAIIRAKTNSPEVITEEDLTSQLLDARDTLKKSNLVIIQTSGSVGVNILSKLAQHIKQVSDISFNDLGMKDKGIIILSDTPFGVLTPSAQLAFNQLLPSYVLLARPDALNMLLEPLSADAAKQKIIESSIGHRLLGAFSARTSTDIGITNFISFGINYLVNKGIPINSISLILMLPVIATILSFSRQVIGMKAFGIVTPAITTLSFLVMGLPYGLLIFSAILISGTLTRLLMSKLHLLYLPRMALVLTGVSIAVLLVFGLGVATDNTALASFSIFPILILTLLAEEFIALQFKSGAKKALTVTAWTLALSIGCYFIVSWQIVRTLFVSYPEIVLLAIPINILLGRWSGLRLTEYIRFRRLLQYIQ